MNSNKTFVLHVFTDWIFPFTTWRLLHWACQKASTGWGRVPPTRRIQEAEARRPRDEGANLWIKGYCTLSPHWMGEFVLLYFFFMRPVIIQICFLFPTLWSENMYHYTFHFSVLTSVLLTGKGKGISYYLATLVDDIYMVLVMLNFF